MAEYIYTIGALAGVMLLSIMINEGRTLGQRQIFVNEVSTQMVDVATTVLDEIDRPDLPFDSKTAGLHAFETLADSLTSPNAFGGCNVMSTCGDVDDFHGMHMKIANRGLEYRVSIDVAYVSRSNPDSIVTTPTMSKMVTVNVTASSVLIGNDSLSASISRVIPYR